jgi:hypothetical protein
LSIKNYLLNIIKLDWVIKYDNIRLLEAQLMSFSEINDIDSSILKNKILKVQIK